MENINNQISVAKRVVEVFQDDKLQSINLDAKKSGITDIMEILNGANAK